MSAEALPISLSGFAEAIKELPLASLYAKVSELRNSIAHLTRSNEELRTYIIESEEGPDSPDNKELENYVLENEEVMQVMAERIGLLKAEVERRGQQWIEEALAADDVNDNYGDGDALEDSEMTSPDNSRSVSAPLVNGIHPSQGANGHVDHEHVNGVSNASNQQNGDTGRNPENDDDDDDEGIYL